MKATASTTRPKPRMPVKATATYLRTASPRPLASVASSTLMIRSGANCSTLMRSSSLRRSLVIALQGPHVFLLAGHRGGEVVQHLDLLDLLLDDLVDFLQLLFVDTRPAFRAWAGSD